MRNIEVSGSITVQEVLEKLGLEEIPTGCELAFEDDVEIVVTADAEDLWEELRDDFADDRDAIPLNELKDAVNALRAGDTKLAMILFESVFGGCLSPEAAVIENCLLQRRAA